MSLSKRNKFAMPVMTALVSACLVVGTASSAWAIAPSTELVDIDTGVTKVDPEVVEYIQDTTAVQFLSEEESQRFDREYGSDALVARASNCNTTISGIAGPGWVEVEKYNCYLVGGSTATKNYSWSTAGIVSGNPTICFMGRGFIASGSGAGVYWANGGCAGGSNFTVDWKNAAAYPRAMYKYGYSPYGNGIAFNWK